MADWITKKEKPKSWITKKKKPKSWITKKVKPTKWITRKPTTKSTLMGTDTTRGGGPDEGSVGHNKEVMSRQGQYRKKPEWIKRKKQPEAHTPLRAKHGIGSLVKKGISKILKPKGVFKPKPVPKAVTDVDKPFKGYDKSYTKADDKKMDAILKNLGDEIKAQPLPPKLKETMKKLKKAYPQGIHARNKESKKVFKSAKGKAAGGRISRGHGGSAAQQHYLQHGYGPTKTKLKSGKPKIAIKGWS